MDKLYGILQELFNLKVDQINDNLSMKEIAAWDSLSHMDLISSLESEFNIELSMDEIMQLKTIANIKSLLLEKRLLNGVEE